MYMKGYLDAILKLGCDALVIAPQNMLDQFPAETFTRTGCRCHVWEPARIFAGGQSPNAIAEALWLDLGKALDRSAVECGRYPQLLLHLYFDAFVTELLHPRCIRRSVHCPIAGLWFKPPQPLRPSLRAYAKRLIRYGRRYRVLRSRQCVAVLLLDPDGAASIPGRMPRILPVPEFTCIAMPDVVPPVVASLQAHSGGRRICSLIGSIDARKGVRAFLDAAATAPADEWCFMMAGTVAWHTFDTETRAQLRQLSERPSCRVMLIDEWLDEQALNALVAESDLLHACYEDWLYSSNMLCKAAAFDTPVIGYEYGYLGRNIHAFQLGVLVPPGTSMASYFARGFAEAVSSLRRSLRFQDGCRRYLTRNRPEALVAALKPLLQELQ
jgi:glycosyltransferase involved in cell wall biosynthesis